MNFFKKNYIAIGFLMAFLVFLYGHYNNKIFAATPIGVATPVPKPISAELTSAIAANQDSLNGSEDEFDDMYTQSEAHMQLDEVKKAMSEFSLYTEGTILKEGEEKIEKTPNEMVTPYLHIIAAALNREVEFKKTHYVFYHSATHQWRALQDLYKLLYAYYNPLVSIKDFVFMRFVDVSAVDAQQYLSEHLKEFGGINDNEAMERLHMISANLAIFGSIGSAGECSWNYFVQNKSHSWPKTSNYQEILDAFNLEYHDIDELVSDANKFAEMLVDDTPEQTIYQIFVPIEKVNKVAWLAWILGFPAHPKAIEIILKSIKGKPLVGAITGPAVKKLMKRFKREGEDNKLYQELLDDVESGAFGLDAFLKIYRNSPWKLNHPSDMQARILITHDIMKDPASGVKYFRYATTSRAVEEKYNKGISNLAKKIINYNKKKNDKN